MTKELGVAGVGEVEVEDLLPDELLQPASVSASNVKKIDFIIFTKWIVLEVNDLFLLSVATVSFSEMKGCKSA
ncbi:hypothetical protein [Vibrio crassostreae]|uniref:hypothetical protein n=1 Tax=Vibrio crassostreae TaxID=246167 RepID=UPI000F49DF0C|nr:hypothetical protein [Vibrio crassostreae]